MGRIYPDLAGAFSRSVGNVVYYLKDGENFARAKSKTPYTSNTPAQQKQKDKFSDLSRLGSIMQEVSAVGFPLRPRRLSPINMFHRMNKNCFVQADGEQVAIDYEHLKCSAGPLFPPQVKATLNAEQNSIEFVCKAMPETTNCKPGDTIYGVLLDTENGFCHLLKLGERKDDSTVSVVLSDFWQANATVAFAFAVSNNGLKASPTVHIPMS